MEQKQQLSKAVTLILGVAFIGIGTLTIFMGMSLTASVLLILIGLIGVLGTLFGVFEEKEKPD